MEMQFEREVIAGYEPVCQTTLCQEETMETIVPDACPDILRIVDVCGQAFLGSKQACDDLVTLSGAVKATVVYQPESGEMLQKMEVQVPFSAQTEAPGLTQQGEVAIHLRLRGADARVLNPRKILLRVDLILEIAAYERREYPVCHDLLQETEDPSICLRRVHTTVCQIHSVQEKTFTFTEHIRLQQTGQGGRINLLAVWVDPKCSESKIIGSKLVFKGNLEIHTIGQSDAGIVSGVEMLPFSQLLEVHEIGEQAECRVQILPCRFQWQSDADGGREMEISVELLAQALTSCKRELTVLEDLYSTSHQVELEKEVLSIPQMSGSVIRNLAVRELLETGSMVRSVVSVRMVTGEMTGREKDGALQIEVPAHLCIWYMDDQQKLQCIWKNLPAACRIDGFVGSGWQCTCELAGDIYATPTADGIEVRFPLEFHVTAYQKQNISAVKSATRGDLRCFPDGPRPSVVLRMVSQGEGIWELAKQYGTTTQKILQANELDSDILPVGRMLLIPAVR